MYLLSKGGIAECEMLGFVAVRDSIRTLMDLSERKSPEGDFTLFSLLPQIESTLERKCLPLTRPTFLTEAPEHCFAKQRPL
jgi:hypothetical protein